MAPVKIHRRILTWITSALVALVIQTVIALPALASSPPSGTIITNQANATYAATNGYVFLPVQSNVVATEISSGAVLQAAVTVNSDPVAVGDVLTYTVTIANSGNLQASAVTVSAVLADNLHFLNASSGGFSNPDGTVTWNLAAVPPGGSVVLTVSATVIGGATTIPISISAASPDMATVSANLVTRVGMAPNLTIVDSSSSVSVNPGGTITYTINYRNKGNSIASGAVITNELPSGAALVAGSITGGGTVAGRIITWPIGVIQPGGGGVVGFKVKVSTIATPGDLISNVSTIGSIGAVIVTSNPLVVTVKAPTISITKTATTPLVLPGNALGYEIVLLNEGGGGVYDIQLRDPLPAGTTFAKADAGGSLQSDGVHWSIASLDPGATVTLHLEVTLDKSFSSSTIANTAYVSATGMGELAATATKVVASRTHGLVEFVDAVGVGSHTVSQFTVGDKVCVQVTDADRNGDPLAAESVSIAIEHFTKQASGAEMVDDSVAALLTENALNSGIFQGCLDSNGGPPVTGDGILSMGQNSTIRATYTDSLDANPVSTAVAFIDPFGVVFDSMTGNPVSNAVVRLVDDATGLIAVLPQPPAVPTVQANPVTTSANGRFQFQYLNPGSYHFVVTPQEPAAGFTFPSAVPDADLHPGYVIASASRGASFTLVTGMQPLNLDIPVDPPPGQLQITKSSNKDVASIGDLVSYTVTLTNIGKTEVTAIKIVDTMPHAVQYLRGSTLITGHRGTDPEYIGNRMISWPLSPLKGGESVTMTYTAVVGPDSQRGDGKNSVRAYGKSAGVAINSNTAFKSIKINEGIFTSDGLIIGKVLLEDGNELGRTGSDTVSGKGVAGAVLYMEDGTRVVTDGDGKFSISGVRPGTHLLRLDESSLPKGTAPVAGGSRFLGTNSSRFVDITPGGMYKANFGVQKTAEQEVAVKDSIAAAASVPHPTPGIIPDLEKGILEMTPELAFLNLTDGMVFQASHIKLLVKAAPDALLTVSVNGKVVDSDKIGKVISSKGVSIYEYVNVPLEPGEQNRIRLETRDPIGSMRESKELSLLTADTVSRIEIIPALKEIPADGTTTVKVRVIVLDRNGTIVAYPDNVTVATSSGDIIESDADPSTPGIQIHCREGVAEFTIKAPFETAEAKISVSYNAIERSIPLFFAPHLRSMMVVGMGEATLGYGKTKGAYSLLKQDTHIDNDLYVWGKGAFFVKGELMKGVLLTASFDSDKKKQKDFFRSGSRNVEAEDKYPIYGDESKSGYEALSREKLYVRADKNRSYLLYGDYETAIAGTRLSVYNRTVTGLKGEINLDYLKVISFGSYTDQIQVVDNLPGQGISGYYYLDKTVLEGTERIVIETRDRQRIDRVLSRQIMSRWSDYSVDYDLGTILFKSPVPSHDSNLNPVYIIATYESRGGDTRHGVYGGRGVLKPLKWLEVGATGVVDQKGTFDYRLLGSDITLKLPGNTTLKAEIAQTYSSFDINNALTRKTGTGWSVEADSTPLPLLILSGYYRSIGDYFDNQSATEAMRGTRKYGVEGKYGDVSGLLLKSRYFDEKDLLNNIDHKLASVGLEKNYRKAKLGMELIRETSTDTYISSASSTSRTPFDIATEAAREMTAVRANAEVPLFSDLSATVSHLQDIQYNKHNLSQLGLNYQLNKGQRLYIREEYAKYEERTENRTVLGAESLVANNTVMFEEYRLASGVDGSRSQQSIGLRNKFTLGEKVTGNLNLEKLTMLRGNSRSSEPDAFAVATGVEYLPLSTVKITSRLEYRQEYSERPQNSWLGEISSACKLHRDYTLIFTERYFYNEFKYEGTRIITRTSAGLAYRPVMNDRFNALAKVELKHEESSIQPQNIVSDAYIASFSGVYQATRSLQLIGKYAGKATVENGFDAYTDLYSARVLYDLTRQIDLGAEYRLLTSHATNSVYQGGAAEIGYRAVKNVWLSMGYSFDRFDADLAGDSYTGEGPFIRMRIKFDENSLKKF